jgi:mitochondrial fission protein ELM1
MNSEAIPSDKIDSTTTPTVPDRIPKVWLVMGYRAGESTQMLALAEALGWPFEIKYLAYRNFDFVPGLLRLRSLLGINRKKSSSLQAPWPDLVISAGMRNEPVCRWIKTRSFGQTQLIQIGRTWAHRRHFDLIVTTAQYRLPHCRNILHNTITLHRVNEKTLSDAAAKWSARLCHLPRPYIAVNIGGNSGPYTFGQNAARRLASLAGRMAKQSGGTLLISTSARTPPATVATLINALDCSKHLFDWASGANDNPYYGYLALADAIIVTCDSIAMLSEACATGKPVYIFNLDQPAFYSSKQNNSSPALDQKPARSKDTRISAILYKLLMRFGPQRLTRDVQLVHQSLIENKRAVWLGQTFPDTLNPTPLDDVQKTVYRVHQLFKEHLRNPTV